VLLDAQTGEEIAKVSAEGISVTLGEEVYLSGYEADQLTGTFFDGDEDEWGVDIARNVGCAIIAGDTVYVYFEGTKARYGEYNGELVALDKYDGSERWTVSSEELPVGNVLAISDGTLYVEHEDSLVTLREGADDDGESEDDGDENERDGDENKRDGDDGAENDDDHGGEDKSEGTEGDDHGDDGEADGDEGAADDEGEDDSEDQEGDDDDQYGGDEEEPDDDDHDDGEVDDGDEDDNLSDDDEAGIDNVDEADEEDDNIDDEDNSENEDGADEADDEDDNIDDEDDFEDEDDDEADSVPGFTTGAGVVGGALGLEWLRRRAAADASMESMNERVESGDEQT
jgi:outer membrane protein assembly factor BamB